jgi:hypothetical protein
MHNDNPRANSAVDAIRCVYLARIAAQGGHQEAARRWRQMATAWLSRFQRSTSRNNPSKREHNPAPPHRLTADDEI